MRNITLTEQKKRIQELINKLGNYDFEDRYVEPDYYENQYGDEIDDFSDDDIDDFSDDDIDDFSHDMTIQRNIKYDDNIVDGDSVVDSDENFIKPKKSKINPHVKTFSKARARKLLKMILNGELTTDNITSSFNKKTYLGKIINDKKEYKIIQSLVSDQMLNKDRTNKTNYRVNRNNITVKNIFGDFDNFYKYCLNVLSYKY